jgi:Putative phage tail protein
MATIILTAVGTAIGGPIGGLIGTLVGSQIDRLVLGGGRREGPRLKDLSVQLASYGEPAPLVYGRARLAGTLIWSSGLIENRSKQKVGGKGGGSVTTYNYSASVAVALSGRPIVDVARIWADGKLIRSGVGAALGPGGQMRLYVGDETQLPDPLIEAAVGASQAPAHRGLAYAVIEDLPLADFGNRVPNLTFEVIADSSETVNAAAVAGDIVARAQSVPTTLSTVPGGYAFARPQSARSALEGLSIAAPFQAYEAGGALAIAPFPASSALTLPTRWLGSFADGRSTSARREDQRQQEAETPADLSLLFWDEARDYQTNVQRARAAGRSGNPTLIEAPAVLTPDAARAAAEGLLDRQAAARRKRTVRLPLAALPLTPGDAVAMDDGTTDLWLIEEMTLDGGVLEVSLVRQPASVAAGPAAPLPPISQTLDPPGPTTVVVMDIALPGQPDLPRLFVAAAGASVGWRRASLYLSRNSGSSFASAAESPAPATLGTAQTILGTASPALWDRRSILEVALLRPDMALASTTEAAVLAGANLCRVGAEIIQFATAQLLPGGTWALSGLLRGRFGSEDAIASHGANEPFVLLDPEDLAAIDLPLADAGLSLQIKALTPQQTLGDVAATSLTFEARALKPLPPVHLKGRRATSGTWDVNWIRRSRTGYAWTDGTDAPLGEESLAFDVVVLSGASPVRTVRVTSEQFTYDLAAQTADFGSGQSTLTLEISQISSRIGRGLPARATLTA